MGDDNKNIQKPNLTIARTQRLEDKIDKVLQLNSKGLPYTMIAEQAHWNKMIF